MLSLFSYLGFVPEDDFDEDFYRKFYPDLPNDVNVRKHYRRHGGAEGRFRNFREALTALQQQHGPLPGDFSPTGYRALNPDVAALYPEEWRLTLHYVQYGRAEGRLYRKSDVDPGAALLRETIKNGAAYDLSSPDGSVPACRPAQEKDFALEVPFRYTVTENRGAAALAAILHCSRPENLPSILSRLTNIPLAVDLYLCADSEATRQAALKHAAGWRKGVVEAKVSPACGRGVAPMLTGFREVFDRYGLSIHLHTEAAPRRDPVDDLIGSKEIARSTLSLFDDPRLGLVFPQHGEGAADLNWGQDYARARSLLRRLGISLNKLLPLEFPSGGAFIARSAAVRPLLELGLRDADFAEGGDETSGTLAGALLRSLSIASESSGHEWVKVVGRNRQSGGALPVNDARDLARHRLKIFRPVMSFANALGWPTPLAPPETRPLLSYPSRNERPRLNLLAPVVDSASGSVALALFGQIAAALGDGWDRRIVAADTPLDNAPGAAIGDYATEPCAPSLDEGGRLLVDASDREGRLNLRKGDVFLAASWWTAGLARGLEADRGRAFGGDLATLRLIEDDDSTFYGAGARAALAADSYRDVGRTLAVMHSEELFAEMTGRHPFRAAWCLPYTMNDRLAALLSPGPRERQILVHARPGVARDAFELVCDGLFRWQQSDPLRARQWSLLFIGEDFPARYLEPLQNAAVGGRLTLETYAERLGRAAVGLSLTLSAHPGPAALDMALAGLQTVANRHGHKDPRVRFPGVITPDRLNGEGVAAAIETAVALAEPSIGKAGEVAPGRLPPLGAWQLLDIPRLASMVATEVAQLSRPAPSGADLRPALKRLFDQAEA